jgi:TorA maturation chaperone TorD
MGELLGALAQDLLALAVLHNRELSAEVLEDLRGVDFPTGLALRLTSRDGVEALKLMAAGLTDIPSPPNTQALDLLSVDYADIYLNHTLRASPCESVWLDEDGLALQEPMFQVRTWFRRYGLATENWRMRSDDHLVLQLHFIAHLLQDASGAGHLGDAARFMDEHLLRWLPDFGRRVATRCSTAFYAGLALLTSAYCEELRELLAEVIGEPRPTRDEVEARLKSTRSVDVPAPQYVPGVAPSW